MLPAGACPSGSRVLHADRAPLDSLPKLNATILDLTSCISRPSETLLSPPAPAWASFLPEQPRFSPHLTRF